MKHIFVDTNLLLHFKRIDQIDWPQLAKSADVKIILAPVIVRELENKKVFADSKKLRERANQTMKWFHKLIDEGASEIRPRVQIEFLDHEPSIDFVSNNLVHAIPDDHLIASILDYNAASDEKLLAANDLGFKVKARNRGIPYLNIPDDLKLPDEPDPIDKENRELRAENQRLKNRQPRLKVMFSGEQTLLSIQERSPKLFDESQEMLAIRRKFPKKEIPASREQLTLITSSPTIFQNNQLVAEKYNRQLDQYFIRYSQYLSAFNNWRQEIARTFEVAVIISNEGSSVATDIDVTLEFPEHIRLMEMDETEPQPQPPSEPSEPNPFGLGGLELVTPVINRPTMRFPELKHPDCPHISVNRVSFSVRSLKHGHNYSLDSFLFRFENLASQNSFPISVFITAVELPQRVEHKLSVVMKMSGTNE